MAGCSGAKLQCKDGTISTTCLCEGGLGSEPSAAVGKDILLKDSSVNIKSLHQEVKNALADRLKSRGFSIKLEHAGEENEHYHIRYNPKGIKE